MAGSCPHGVPSGFKFSDGKPLTCPACDAIAAAESESPDPAADSYRRTHNLTQCEPDECAICYAAVHKHAPQHPSSQPCSYSSRDNPGSDRSAGSERPKREYGEPRITRIDATNSYTCTDCYTEYPNGVRHTCPDRKPTTTPNASTEGM